MNTPNTPGPGTPPLPSLSQPLGGGMKPLIIMGILAVLIGGGIWALSAMGDRDTGGDEKVEKEDEVKPTPKPKPRKKVKTTSRPPKSEMATLTSEDPDEFAKNVGKWVILQGKVSEGNDDGLIVFESPAWVTAQLVRGSASNLTGESVRIICWMVSEKKAQVDGKFDIAFLEAGDLLPDQDYYTSADYEKLVSLRNKKATFEGRVSKVRLSEDQKHFILEFEGGDHDFLGRGIVKDLKARDVDLEGLKGLEGKVVRLTGKIIYEKDGEKKDRLFFEFRDEHAYTQVD